MLTIAIWTENPTKIKAIKSWITQVSELATEEIHYICQKVETWVSEMPLTQESTDQWAKNRAENLVKMWIQADFYAGLEWWCYQQGSDGFLTGSVYISDWKKWFLWKWPSIQMPENITHELFQNKRNLWELIEEITKTQNISKVNGTFGILSNDLITRSKSFEIATILAITPFFNGYYN